MKWLHNILKGASLTGALFVFQACYGVPQTPAIDLDETEENPEAVVSACDTTLTLLPAEDIVPEPAPER